MSTKTKKICIEVEQVNSITKRIEVLEVFEKILEETEHSRGYYTSDAVAYEEQGMDSYAEKQLARAKSYEYVIEILEKIASEI